MNILFINGLHPTPINLMRGIFVTNRLKFLRNYDNINFYSISPVMKDGRSIIFLRKILKKPQLIQYPPKMLFNGINFHFVNVEVDLWTKILNINFCKLALNSIDKHVDIKKYDLIHAHLPYPHGYIAYMIKQKYNIPYVVTSHGSDINISMEKNKSKYLEVLENANKAIFVSNKLLDKAKSYGYSGFNSVVIGNGFDPSIFYPIDKTIVRKELNVFKDDHKYVGFVGNLIPIKRADKLIEIFEKVRDRIPKVRFIVVGDGILKNKMIEEAKLKNLDVAFTGRLSQKEVAKYINIMDIMVLPSRNEGWPCVILETQACGTLVIGSDNGGIPEALGYNEFIVKEGELFEKRFAQRVVYFLKNGYDKNKLIERVRNYTWKNIVNKETSIYKEILSIDEILS